MTALLVLGLSGSSSVLTAILCLCLAHHDRIHRCSQDDEGQGPLLCRIKILMIEYPGEGIEEQLYLPNVDEHLGTNVSQTKWKIPQKHQKTIWMQNWIVLIDCPSLLFCLNTS